MAQFIYKGKWLFLVCFILPGILLGCSDHSKSANQANQNFDTANFDTVKRAAEGGNANAQNKLGEMYTEGLEVERNLTEGVEWFRKAADQGNAHAQLHLGTAYLTGVGVPRDDAEAEKWIRKAADQGDPMAKALLKKMAERNK